MPCFCDQDDPFGEHDVDCPLSDYSDEYDEADA